VELDIACVEAVLSGARAIGPDRLLTLNLSPRTLEARDFDASWLLQGLYRNGISPGRVILELTERDEIADLVHLRHTFQVLQQYGLRLAADDVGAGNAGLRLLSQVQFDIVKIDLSLVHDGVRRVGARAVLQSLRDLALSQRAHVVAEGVETREQLQVIQELEIGAGQGFLLGRPDASVAATFVDIGRIGSGLLPVTGIGLVSPDGSPVTASPRGEPSGEGAERPDIRSIVRPRARLGGRFEVEAGAA
jgi:EAL domain-containing protein (putative c-di-GMP-specific phosphodiesterase class I)